MTDRADFYEEVHGCAADIFEAVAGINPGASIMALAIAFVAVIEKAGRDPVEYLQLLIDDLRNEAAKAGQEDEV